MTTVSFFSRFTSRKGNDFATKIQNGDSHCEFLETHANKRCSEMIKSTALVGACKNTTWFQVSCTLVLFTPAIIGSYEATKNHLIDHVSANTISSRSGASISQVATNPSEISKSNWDAHISDTSKNDLLGNIPCLSTLRFEKKKSIWDERDCRGIKRPYPSSGRGPGCGG